MAKKDNKQDLAKAVKNVKEAITDAVDAVTDKVKDVVNSPEVQEAVDTVAEKVSSVVNEVKDAVSDKIKDIKVQMENEKIDAKIPEGPLAEKWTNYKAHQKLVNPANKRRLDIIVVGTGLAGASAAASLAEMGFNVLSFCIQDSPRRAHSIAAQGGINAAKNYQNDGDSVYRLFYDTIKGGDYRAREANVYRLAEVSNNIIDQCVAQGVPFAREYGGLLDNRSFGGAQVSRTFYAKGQTGQQLLLGAYSALSRQIGKGKVKMYSRYEMLDVVIIDGRARGIIARNLVTGKIERFFAHAVVIGSGGYGNTFFLSTNAMASNGSAAMQMYRKGAYFANPCFAQIHPTCIPVHGDYQSKLTLMSESLRNDGRIWVPKKLEDAKALQQGKKKGRDIPEEDRDYYLERRYPAFGNLVPRDVASRAAKERCDAGYGVNSTGLAVFLDFSEAIERMGKPAPLREPDDDISRNPLHDGRHLGRLRIDDIDQGLVLHRRGQFLRPRRKPLGRVGVDAGSGRRLFRIALYHTELFGRPDFRSAHEYRPSRVRRGRESSEG